MKNHKNLQTSWVYRSITHGIIGGLIVLGIVGSVIVLTHKNSLPDKTIGPASVQTIVASSPLKQGKKKMFNIDPYAAPELQNVSNWINSNPLTIAELKGKVILVDFWTYSCFNCINTQPYLNSWQADYADKGLVIIGVHAPEFAYEKVPNNVMDAVKKAKITYPVALDNDFTTWNAYHNQYWPARYLIDKEGLVRYTHFGEGAYDETNQNIQELLNEKV